MTGAVEGLSETLKALAALGADVKNLKSVFVTIGTEGAAAVAKHTPTRSGRLRSRIRVDTTKANSVQVIADTPYSAVINYGWPKRGIRPSHFMQKGDADIAPRLPTIVNDGLTALIRKNGLDQS